MLLAEAALAHDARHGGALRLAIDANRALLERSGRSNFWEAGWLENRFARSSGRWLKSEVTA